MYIINNTCWLYISVFYGRDSWSMLIEKAHSFYLNNIKEIFYFLLYLSDIRGEHIRIAFASELNQKKNVKMQKKIDEYFQSFTQSNPSSSAKKFQYGKFIWKYFENNTVVWNNFEIRKYEKSSIKFAQRTTFLIRYLLKNDTSIDNTFSVGLFLCTQLSRLLDKKNIDSTFNMINDNIINNYDNFDSYNETLGLTTQNNINIINIFRIIEEYYEKDHYDNLGMACYDEWLNEAELLFSLYENNQAFTILSSIICDHLGIYGSNHLLIINFLQRWFNHKDIIQK